MQRCSMRRCRATGQLALATAASFIIFFRAASRSSNPFNVWRPAFDRVMSFSRFAIMVGLFSWVRRSFRKGRTFAREGEFHEEFFTQCAMQDERSCHFPVAGHLSQPVVLLGTRRHGDFRKIVGAVRPEGDNPPLTRLPHLGLTA